MTDELLLPLANVAASCYDEPPNYSWQDTSRLVHLVHTVVNNYNTFGLAGTLDLREWIMRDFLAAQIPVEGHPLLGDVHAGFLLDGRNAVEQYIAPTLEALGWPPFYITGHSKGAGDGLIAHALLKDMGHKPLATRLYEAPMVGGADLLAFVDGDDLAWTQTYNAGGDDIITIISSLPTFRILPKPIRLKVPDGDDWATKHRIPAVLAALATLS